MEVHELLFVHNQEKKAYLQSTSEDIAREELRCHVFCGVKGDYKDVVGIKSRSDLKTMNILSHLFYQDRS